MPAVQGAHCRAPTRSCLASPTLARRSPTTRARPGCVPWRVSSRGGDGSSMTLPGWASFVLDVSMRRQRQMQLLNAHNQTSCRDKATPALSTIHHRGAAALCEQQVHKCSMRGSRCMACHRPGMSGRSKMSALAGPVALQPHTALQLLWLRARRGRPQHHDADGAPLIHALPPRMLMRWLQGIHLSRTPFACRSALTANVEAHSATFNLTARAATAHAGH